MKNAIISIDVGTATISALMILENSSEVFTCVIENPQKKYGFGCDCRLEFSKRTTTDFLNPMSNFSKLHWAIIDGIQQVVSKIKIKNLNIKKIRIAGNTIMLSFLCGFSAKKKVLSKNLVTTWKNLCDGAITKDNLKIDKNPQKKHLISDETIVDIYPALNNRIGSDFLCTYSVFNTLFEKKSFLMVDIGSLTQIALKTQTGKVYISDIPTVCFDGENLDCGMSTIDGAIENFDFDDKNFNLRVKGNTFPQGICFSGFLSCVSNLKKQKLINKNGSIFTFTTLSSGTEIFELTDAIYISRTDIERFKIEKSWFVCLLNYFIDLSGATKEELNLCITGSGGMDINLDDMIELDLIPESLRNKVTIIPNATLIGLSSIPIDINKFNDFKYFDLRRKKIKEYFFNYFLDYIEV